MTDEYAEPACPVCGNTVNAYDYRPGYRLEINSPYGRDMLFGTGDEIYEDRRSRMADVLAMPKPHAPSTQVDLQPCGHALKGDEASRFLTAAAQFALAEKRKAAQRVLDADRALLDAAEDAGHHELVGRYRAAVHADNNEAAGLRVALATLTDYRPRERA